MADDLDTGKETPAQGSDDSAPPSQIPPGDVQDTDDDKPLTKQQAKSWFGRIVKKQLEEDVVPLIKREFESLQQRQPPPVPRAQNDGALKKFNEELSEEIFTNPLSAIQKAVKAIEESKTQLSKTQMVQVDKAITSYSEDPLYKDIYQDMKKIAHDAVKEGYPPGAAARYALAEAKAGFFEKRVAGSDGGGGLNLSDGGKQTRSTKTPKLPPEFKRAFEKDKAKGLFKTEAEYIEHLSPSIRAKYGF